MTVSKDVCFTNVPVWRVYVDLPEFIARHPLWEVSLIRQWFSDGNGNAPQFEDSSLLSESLNVSGLLQFLPDDAVVVGYHVERSRSALSWFQVAFIVARPPVFDGSYDSDWVEFSSSFFPSFPRLVTHLSQHPQRVLVDDVLTAGSSSVSMPGFVSGDSRFTVSLDGCFSHHWLHCALFALAPYDRTVVAELYCSSTDPLFVAERISAGFLSFAHYPPIVASLCVSSHDLSDFQNEFRLVASMFVSSVDVDDISDAVDAVLS